MYLQYTSYVPAMKLREVSQVKPAENENSTYPLI